MSDDALLAPDVVPDDSWTSQYASLEVYAQDRHNEFLAQLRFMGLLAGIKGPNDTDQDVDDAQNAVLDALSDFLNATPHPDQLQINTDFSQLEQTLSTARAASRNPHVFRDIQHWVWPQMATPQITDELVLEAIANGDARRSLNREWLAAGSSLSQDDVSALMSAMDQSENIARNQLAENDRKAEGFRNWLNGIWGSIEGYYNETIDLIKSNQYLLAAGRLAIDGAYLAAEELLFAAILGAIAALTGGVAVIAGAAIRAAITVVKVGIRVGDDIATAGPAAARQTAAATVFRIQVRKIDAEAIDGVYAARPGTPYTHQIDVDRDLLPDERRAVGEGGQGSTVRDADPPENGSGGDGGVNLDDPPAYQHPRAGDPPRSNDVLAPNGRVPFDRNNPSVFQNWWDDLSYEELNQVLAVDGLRRRVDTRVRNGGGEHEWLKVSQQLEHKRLGFSMREIQDWVTATDVAEGPLPTPTADGATRWRHTPEGGGTGSGVGSRTMHNALDGLYSPPVRNRNEFLRRMGHFANSYLDGGVDGLPAGLRDAILSAGGG